MSTVLTSSSAVATGYGNQRKIDRTSNGVLWAVDYVGGSTTWVVQVAYSADTGTTWTAQPASTITNNSGSAVQNYTANPALFIDADDYAHLVYRDNYSGNLLYRRGTPTTPTAYTWSAAVTVQGVANYDVPDVVAFRDPAGSGGWVVHIVAAQTSSSYTQKVAYSRLSITSTGATTVTVNGLIINDNLPTASANSVLSYPSIDFQHTGDGKTPVAAPALFVGWSNGATGSGLGIRFKKATYAASAWTWGTEREIDSTRYVGAAGYWLATIFDGTRVVLAGEVTGAAVAVVAHERDTADTTTTLRTLKTSIDSTTTDDYSSGSVTYDGSGNLYFVGGTASAGTGGVGPVGWARWTRATATLGARTVIDATGKYLPYVSARRAATGSRLDFVYTDGTASPYTVTYGSALLNQAPNAPGALTPAAGSVDRTITQRLSWAYSDPDAGDTQSKADVQWRTNTSGTTGSWQTVTVTTPNPFWDAPAVTFPTGGIEWQARTYDATGVVGPWSPSAFFTAATPPAVPTITAPISGATIPTSTVTLQFSEPNLDSFDWRVLGDKTGIADPTVVVNVGGTVADPTARAVTIKGLPNTTTVHLQVRVSYQGLKSTWADSRNPVSYTPPPKPVVALLGDDTTGSLTVTVNNPTPTGTQPTVTVNEVWVDDGAGFTRRKADLAPGGTWAYRLPISGRDYTGRVRVVAVAVNGTTTTS